MERKKAAGVSKTCRTDRPDFLKIPFISMGILLGAVAIPPLTETATAGKDAKRIVKGFVRIGSSKRTFPIPAFIINKALRAGAKRARKRVAAFSKEKKALHHFVVKNLPQVQKLLSLDYIAKELDLPLETVSTLVDELEREKTFLYREDSNAVNWAYPVTVRDTPHRVTFSSGEQINAA